MRLLAVELVRFRSRRAIALMVLATLLVAAVFALVATWQTRPLTEADRADAAAQAELEGKRPELQQTVAACREDPSGFLGDGMSAADCEAALVPDAESYYPRPSLDIGSLLTGDGLGLATIVVGVMVIAGSTFVGADWATGSMSNQLIFEPRRLRVWLAKAIAVTLCCGLVALVAIGGYWSAVGAVAEARGLAVPAGQVSEVFWHVFRTVTLSMGAGLGAYALTMVFRHTVATLALLFVYAVGGEILVNLLPVEGAGRWSVGNNILGWLAGSHRYFDATVSCAPGQRCGSMETLTALEASSFLGGLLLLSVVVSLLWFRLREA